MLGMAWLLVLLYLVSLLAGNGTECAADLKIEELQWVSTERLLCPMADVFSY